MVIDIQQAKLESKHRAIQELFTWTTKTLTLLAQVDDKHSIEARKLAFDTIDGAVKLCRDHLNTIDKICSK